jgi:GGDEF domain-containing protein
MISIRSSIDELQQCHDERAIALDCYLSAIKNTAFYLIDFDSRITDRQRGYLSSLSEAVATGGRAALEESRATLRGLLRDYRDKAAEHLGILRDELAGTTRALEETLESLSQSDGDHQARLKKAVQRLRNAAATPQGASLKDLLLSASSSIEESVEEMRKQHLLAISHFQAEIRLLHKRIDALETSSLLEQLGRLLNKEQIEQHIRGCEAGYRLLLARVSGFRRAEGQFCPEVAAELAAAFAKRLRNSLPASSVIGRWSHEEFVAVVQLEKSEAITLAKWISENLSGSYACLQAGKSVRASVQITVAVVDSTGQAPALILQRVHAFFTGVPGSHQ